MRIRVVAHLFGILLLAGLAGCGSNNGGTEEDVTAQDQSAQEDDTVQEDIAAQDNVQMDNSSEDQAVVEGTPHPFWGTGVIWESFLPADGETAVYTVRTFQQEELDLTAYLEHNVEWKGGTWSRIVLGSTQPGAQGQTIYVDLSVPWQASVKGIEVFDEQTTDGPMMVEYFDDPIVLPLNLELGSTFHHETTIHGNYNGFEDSMGIVYDMEVTSYDDGWETDLGFLEGCVKIVVTLSGELIGSEGAILEVEIVAHPEQRIVHWVDAPGFILLDLKEAWK